MCAALQRTAPLGRVSVLTGPSITQIQDEDPSEVSQIGSECIQL